MKLGRNEPCHCGSGRKYKKCCLDADRQESLRECAPPTGGEFGAAPDLHDLRRRLEEILSSEPTYEEVCYGPEDGPLHAIACRLVGEGASAPDADEAREIAELASFAMLDEAIDAIMVAEDFGRSAQVAAYETLTLLMMETLERRAALGLHGGEWSLDRYEQSLARDLLSGELRIRILNIFRRLRARMEIAGPSHRKARAAGERGETSADINRLRARINALRTKTVDQGCTEEEALAAAEKVAELLDRYGLSLGEAEIAKQTCETFAIETGRKRGAPFDLCIPALGAFCDCRVWMEKSPDEEIRYIVFGLPGDIAGARYLHEMIERAFITETGRFKAGDLYGAHPSGQRRSATASFQTGLANGICRKLGEIKAARDALRASGGRELVLVKSASVDEEFDKLGLSLTKKRISGQARKLFKHPYEAGAAAGAEFEWRPGLTG